mgnify:FL=1
MAACARLAPQDGAEVTRSLQSVAFFGMICLGASHLQRRSRPACRYFCARNLNPLRRMGAGRLGVRKAPGLSFADVNLPPFARAFTAFRVASGNAAKEAVMARATNRIPVVNLIPSRSARPEPGAYLVHVSKTGEIDVEQLPADALLLNGASWEKFFAAFRDMVPVVARRGAAN